MKSWMVGLGLVLILICPSWGQSPPPPTIELVPFVPANRVVPTLSVEISLTGDQFVYRYTLANGPSAEQPVKTFTVVHGGSTVSFVSPRPWVECKRGDAYNLLGKPAFGWVPHRVEQMIQPGQSFTGFECRSDSLPGCTTAYVEGDVPLLRENQNYSNQADVLPPQENNLKVPTIAPMIPPASVVTPQQLSAALEPNWRTGQQLGWLPSSGVVAQAINSFLAALTGGGPSQISSATGELSARLESEQVSSNGLALVKPSVAYVARLYPPPTPTNEARSATKDALVFEKSPHANEGANPRLTLEKITGKASRNLLGFDLSAVRTTGLTSATLVLSIDASQGSTGWGNGETVSVVPLTTTWTEGNGKSYGLPNNQSFVGSGSGTTWFSPTDTNISNSAANSATQWNGAASNVGNRTAPTLVVSNHQTGELRFNVTTDVLNGAPNGWLLRKDAENKGSKISFYSREGAAAAGDSNLAPRLIFNYSGSTAWYDGSMKSLADSVGLGSYVAVESRTVTLQALPINNERPSLRDRLRQSPKAAYAAEHIMGIALNSSPLAEMAGRAAYRSWLRGTPTLV